MIQSNKLFLVNRNEIEKVRKYFEITEEDMKRDVGILKEWLKQEPHLPDDEDDWFLENMLIANKLRMERTKERLENLYTARSLYPDLAKYYDVDDVYVQQALEAFIIYPLPNLTKNLERCLFVKARNPQSFHVRQLYAVCSFLDYMRHKDYSLTLIYVYDWTGTTLDMLRTLDLNICKSIYHIILNSISIRYSRLIHINAPPYIDILMKIYKVLMKSKLFERIVVDKSTESLYKFIPKEYLPKDYGGEAQSISEFDKHTIESLYDDKEFLKKIGLKRSNESLRTKPLEYNELYGVDGTFKLLNID